MIQIEGEDNAMPQFEHCCEAEVSINSYIFDI